MATGSYNPVPIALGSPTTETEEGRAFFQERVGRFGMWVFFISGGFYVMALGLGSTFDPGFNWPTTPFTGGQLLHLLGTLVVGVVSDAEVRRRVSAVTRWARTLRRGGPDAPARGRDASGPRRTGSVRAHHAGAAVVCLGDQSPVPATNRPPGRAPGGTTDPGSARPRNVDSRPGDHAIPSANVDHRRVSIFPVTAIPTTPTSVLPRCAGF